MQKSRYVYMYLDYNITSYGPEIIFNEILDDEEAVTLMLEELFGYLDDVKYMHTTYPFTKLVECMEKSNLNVPESMRTYIAVINEYWSDVFPSENADYHDTENKLRKSMLDSLIPMTGAIVEKIGLFKVAKCRRDCLLLKDDSDFYNKFTKAAGLW